MGRIERFAELPQVKTRKTVIEKRIEITNSGENYKLGTEISINIETESSQIQKWFILKHGSEDSIIMEGRYL